MDPLHRLGPSPRRRLELLAYAILAAGFVLMLLGILEIGGLFNVGLGLVTVWVGCLVLFAEEGRRRPSEEEEFMRELRDF